MAIYHNLLLTDLVYHIQLLGDTLFFLRCIYELADRDIFSIFTLDFIYKPFSVHLNLFFFILECVHYFDRLEWLIDLTWALPYFQYDDLYGTSDPGNHLISMYHRNRTFDVHNFYMTVPQAWYSHRT